jgi:hypothetical protein
MQLPFAGGESAIAVTSSGAVFYAPAVQSLAGTQAQYFLGGNSGFARTTNRGASWEFVLPVSPNLAVPANPLGKPGWPAWDQIDDKFYADRRTGRLFWADPDLPSEAVIWTDDDGLSWGYSLLPVGFGGEWTQVTAAPAPAGGAAPADYPEVVYACGEYDSIARDVSTSFEGDLCQKSLDGGQTWAVAGQGMFGSPLGSHPQCAGATESPNFSPWAAPDPQGRLYELLFCAGRTYLLRSSDEGATWPIYVQVPFRIPNVGPGDTGSAELRTDAHGNLYLAWTDPGNPNPNGAYAPGRLYLATSSDGGRTWSRALDVLAPGVQGLRTHFGFDVGAPGHVAFSYLGKAWAAGFDGYITETADALAPAPRFWSGIVDDPAQAPLDAGGKGSSGGLGLDYVSVAIGPDGTPWASFWDDCGATQPPVPGCPPARRPPPGLSRVGYADYAGRLAPAPGRGTPRGSKPRGGGHRGHRGRGPRRRAGRRSAAAFTG